MLQLNHGVAAVSFDASGEPGQPGNMPVVMGAKLPGETHTAVLHRRGTGHGQTEAALCPHTQPVEFVFTEGAVRGTLKIGKGCQYESIGQGRPIGEDQWF